MLKFLQATLPNNPKALLKFDEGNNKTTWLDCTAEVKSFAVQNIKAGDMVEITTEQREGKNVITRISKGGTASPAPAAGSGTAQPAQQEQKQQAAPIQRSDTGKYRDPLTPDEAKTIRRQSVMSSAVSLCLCNQSQLPLQPDGLADFAIAVYRKLLAAIEEK